MQVLLDKKRVFTIGLLFGLLFPLLGILLSYTTSWENTFRLLSHSSLFYIICSAPLILSALPYYLIKRQEKFEKERDEQKLITEKATALAKRIKSGDFTLADNTNTNDELSTALSDMQKTLRFNHEKEAEAAWINSGIAEVSAILRLHTSIKKLGDELTLFLANKINVVQSAFYIVNIEDKLTSGSIEMVSRYAYNRKKHSLPRFKIGQGLVGQAVIENDAIYRTEIPDTYVSITSGLLGDKKPKSIFIIPLVTNEKPYGALEFASIHPISELHRKFLKSISEIIAQTIFNLNVTEQTARHLTEVNNAQVKQNTLLLNASEIITIYDKSGTIKYIAPSVERILGYSQNELIGKKDVELIHTKGVPAYEQLFDSLTVNPSGIAQAQFSVTKKDGSRIWMEAFGRNMLDNPIINGIVLNTRDITMKRLAEKEERKRGQMQALSENSPDLIIRIDASGLIYYINPAINKFTTSDTSAYIAKQIDSCDIDQPFAKQLMAQVLETVNKKEPVISEVSYKTFDKKYILGVKTIPEFNEIKRVETVLVVASDITETKEIQLAIEASNKKVTESINYAQRIQTSLLPVIENIKSHFPNSLLYFKPKDVVSGDFPYLYTKGDNIYIAAVDCTGHGVPGALMSFIGYFILNQILSEVKDRNAAEVLDELHARVQATLKQDTGESKSRDGMDIALCKINLKKNTLEFSGAHRPLYQVSNGILNEIKADKYPIAGMHYKTRQPFVNNVLEIKKGDVFFFNTDGLPDQFGGPDGTKKLTSNGVKELLQRAGSLDMENATQLVSNTFEQWKGNYKQMDDVLLIGLKF